MGSGISIRVYGDVYLAEIALSIMAIFSIIRGNRVFNRTGTTLVPFIFMSWFLANLCSSVINSKPLNLILISIFTVIISGLCLRSILEFFQKYPTQIVNALIVFSLGRVIGLYFQPLPYTPYLPWKFGYGEWVIIITLLIGAKFRNLKIIWVLVPILAIFSLNNEARTLTLLLVIALLASQIKKPKKFSFAFLIAVIFIPILSYNLYLDIALSGKLGEREILRAQNLASTDLGPLAARKEFIFSVDAFLQAPFIGYGFDPEVEREILEKGAEELLEQGIKVDYSYLRELPMHSFLMSSIVQGGIFAGMYWFFLIIIVTRDILFAKNPDKFIEPLRLYISLSLLDRIFFSPYGAYERLTVAFFASFILIIRKSRDANV